MGTSGTSKVIFPPPISTASGSHDSPYFPVFRISLVVLQMLTRFVMVFRAYDAETFRHVSDAVVGRHDAAQHWAVVPSNSLRRQSAVNVSEPVLLS